MRILALILAGLCLSGFLPAQKCGTFPPQQEKSISYEKEAYIGERAVPKNTWKRAIGGRLSVFSIQFYLVSPDGLSAAAIIDDLDTSLELLNSHFREGGVKFQREKKVIEVVNESLAFFDFPGDEYLLKNVGERKESIKVFLVFSIADASGNLLDGYTYHPDAEISAWQKEIIVISLSKLMDGSTLSHEMGHFFGLKHTHEFHGTSRGEYVDRSSCSSRGDGICDTPADPNLLGWVDTKGRYTGTKTDPEGRFYEPMVENLMSYSPARFRTRFTIGQNYHIEQTALFKRQHLIIKTAAREEGDFSAIANISLSGAFEHFQLGGPDQVLMFIHKDSASWSKRNIEEISLMVEEHPVNLIKGANDYSLVVFDVSWPDEENHDFIGNVLFPKSSKRLLAEYEWLINYLNDEQVEYPCIIILQFTNNYKFGSRIKGLYPGYWKVHEVKEILGKDKDFQISGVIVESR